MCWKASELNDKILVLLTITSVADVDVVSSCISKCPNDDDRTILLLFVKLVAKIIDVADVPVVVVGDNDDDDCGSGGSCDARTRRSPAFGFLFNSMSYFQIESSQQKWIQTESVDDDDDDGNKNGKETINI
ncbi:hypothetical protein DERF_014865 [Dermatophagoides farinae]|uniref:Uncharacterized protein n=1 Tax=Dermatophagoides farinae TaxID=6954 RepID=A0A922HKC6_DERFA|nr:hypothetical protein DERF_014865 [Dermatophagoides farinae]